MGKNAIIFRRILHGEMLKSTLQRFRFAPDASKYYDCKSHQFQAASFFVSISCNAPHNNALLKLIHFNPALRKCLRSCLWTFSWFLFCVLRSRLSRVLLLSTPFPLNVSETEWKSSGRVFFVVDIPSCCACRKSSGRYDWCGWQLGRATLKKLKVYYIFPLVMNLKSYVGFLSSSRHLQPL